ncbi:carbohydrate sulfotransferase 12-like [Thalassophryne amazonica]|uniref:carbohydrate sulfotransferase 12-like n=1 Tax=Thalassophryne amazonica TaxID=390379 RepID=UPI001470CCA5|nr:carbohydrate sulfotransferase 12-like [Thalassophryne amazonica]
MGTWRCLRGVFILGSLFVILLLVVYWDDIGGFNVYPVQDPKHQLHDSEPGPWVTSCPSHLPIFFTTATLMPTDIPEERGAAAENEKQSKTKFEIKNKEEEERPSDAASTREQEERKQRIMDVCSGKDVVEFPGRTRTFDQIPNKELDHLIVDDKHRIIYCYVPKVACTNWKRVMVVLSQSLISPSSGKPYTDPEAIPSDLVHNSSLHLTFAKFWRHYGSLSRHLMALKLQHYTKFLFVRDPFVRLISAFRNKLARPNKDFYQQFGSVMLHRYSNVSGNLPETAADAFAAGIKPTFQQFIAYLLDPETEKEAVFNEHWRQVYRLCHPCQVNYDFIGRLETLETDAEQLLRMLEVDQLLHFPSGARNRTAASWEKDWFTQIPLTMRRDLYKLYEPDFELFGYPIPGSVLHQ